jgi:hypothetical protein
MARLEDHQPKASVRGILPDRFINVGNVQWFGSVARELTYKRPSVWLPNELLYRQLELGAVRRLHRHETLELSEVRK